MARQGVGRRRWGLALILAAAALAALAPGASAELSFCPPGSGAGQCQSPNGLASDFEEGLLYVADTANHRIAVFDAEDGEFLLAFGWGVNAEGPAEELQVCTTATGCQAGSSGSGPGQFSSPRSVAVDNSGGAEQGKLYVGTDNRRVQKFAVNAGAVEASFELAFGWGVNAEGPAEELQVCTAVTGCLAGVAGPAECQIGGTSDRIAVDPAGIVELARSRFLEEEFPGGPGIFENRVERFQAGGSCAGEVALEDGQANRIAAFALGAAGELYLSFEVIQGIHVYGPAGEGPQCEADAGINSTALGVDATGRLFAGQREPSLKTGPYRVITEYDSACAPKRRFAYDQLSQNAGGIAAFHGPAGDVFAVDGSAIRYLQIPVPGPIAVTSSLRVLDTGNTQATVQAEVNPEGKETEVLAQYVDQAAYEADLEGGGDGFEGPATEETEAQVLEVPAGREFRVNAAQFLLGCPVASEEAIEEGKCLVPAEQYHWRVVARNEDNPTGEAEGTSGQGSAIETKDPVDIQATWASAVGVQGATLSAMVDPLGIPTTGFFEYVEQASYEESGFATAKRAPTEAEGELDFGSGKGAVTQSASLSGLSPHTTYRYRLAATNPLSPEAILSPERTLISFAAAGQEPCPNDAVRLGAGALLPDCRAYEMVSPPEKEGGDVVVLGQVGTSLPAVVSQSAASGDRLTYGSFRAFGNALSAPFTSQYLAEREEGGWESAAISPPRGHSIAGNVAGEFTMEFRSYSTELCEGWLVPLADPPLAAGATPGHLNLYRRVDPRCAEGGEASFEALSTGEPEKLTTGFSVEPQGHSEDGAVSVFAANDSLSETTAPPQPGGCTDTVTVGCESRLYVKGAGGALRYACILPGGAPSGASCSAGTNTAMAFGTSRLASLAGALSADGTHLYWTDASGGATSGFDAGRIYRRENPLGAGGECEGGASPCTKEVSKDGEEASGVIEDSIFWAGARDGSRAIYSAGEDLYEYEAEAEASTPIAGSLAGVMGASEDASRLYFASREAIGGAGENSEGASAVAGKPNLYLHEAGGAVSFVATLAEADVIANPGQSYTSATAGPPGRRASRVSADGAHVAFMSEAPLTGYDNTDLASPVSCEPGVAGICDNEIFLYDTEAGEGEGVLRCASCNPSGARPAGANLADEPPLWAAARIRGWESSLHASRNLAADGARLFFESQDPLVARDTNGRLDVYQWEEPGTGSCTKESDSFSAPAGGCIELISSGQSALDVRFIDASPSGADVFFTTLASLYGADFGQVDAYDARIGGGFDPPPDPPPECEGESCQSPPPAPAAPAPPSASYVGPGNLPAPKKKKARRCPKGKHKVKRKGKVRCAKNKRAARRAHHHRLAHQRAGRPR